MLRFISILVVLISWQCIETLPISNFANPGDPTTEITVSELHEHIALLASDSLKGRKPGTEECRTAAEYIRNDVIRNGLEPIGENGFQYFEVVTSARLGEENKMSFSQFEGRAREDFTPLAFSNNTTVSASVVFVGYGFDFEMDSLSWHDYENTDVVGKWVFVLLGDPESDRPHSIYAEYSSLRKKVLVARDKGAVGVIFVSGETFDESDKLIPLVYDQSQTSVSIPVLQIKRSVADILLKESGHTVVALENQLNESHLPNSFQVNKILDITTDVLRQKVTTQNVVALLPGSDPALNDEFILIGAHYDHLGFGGPHSGSREPDTLVIHNGADDNASGVAAILEIIEKLAANRDKLRRSILFMAFGAEEMGLLGSKFFTRNPLIELAQVKLMFNFDMLGRLDPETKALIVGGTGTGAGLSAIVEEFASGRDLDLKLSPEGYGPSDHASFYIENIPVLFFMTGIHEDYHKSMDDVEKINLEGEVVVADYAYDLIVELANRTPALTYQEAGPKEQPTSGRRRFKVTLGIMPDYASAESHGLRVDGVMNDRPAKLAGMQKGDIIIAMEGKPVNDIYDYMYRLAEFKPGQRISVEVLRAGTKIILIVNL